MDIRNVAIGFLLVLGILILVHEWGHFIVARLFGVRVDVFSIGFGPRLFGWKRGATDYRVSAIPLGGYVRMAGQKLQIVFEHKGETRSAEVTTAGMQVPDLLFGYPPNRPIVGSAERDKPAFRAGLRRDDVILSIDAKPINNWQEMVAAIQSSGGKPMPTTVRRKNQTLSLTITPVSDKNDKGESVWIIGIRPGQEYSFRRVGVTRAVTSATDFTVGGTWQVIDIVGKLVTGKVAAKQLQSVIGIASEAGQAVQEGTFAVVTLMAALSLNLGILNLLPIPILDGGNILLLTMEGIRRRDFSLSFKERFVQVGLEFLLMLFAYVMYNDVMRLLPIHS